MTGDLRRATPADADALVALVESAYRGEASRAGWTTEADLLRGRRLDLAMAQQVIDDPDGAVLVRGAGELTACVQVRDLGGGAGYLGMFAVRPSEQGAGTGTAVLRDAEHFARATWSLASIEMTVIEQRAELIAYYERRGYRRTGETKPFPYGDDRFGVPRRDDLTFTVLRKEF